MLQSFTRFLCGPLLFFCTCAQLPNDDGNLLNRLTDEKVTPAAALVADQGVIEELVGKVVNPEAPIDPVGLYDVGSTGEGVRRIKILRINPVILENGSLADIPIALIKRLSALEELFVNDMGFRGIPPEIGSLQNLRILNLENNLIETVPAEIADLSELRILNLSFNRISELPGLGRLENLALLYLHRNSFTQFPFDALQGIWGNLTQFSIRHNNICDMTVTMIPQTIIDAIDIRDPGWDTTQICVP